MAKKKSSSNSNKGKKKSSKKQGKAKSDVQDKRKGSARSKFVKFFAGIFGLGIIVYVTPLYDIIDKGTGGMLTNILADIEPIPNNNDDYNDDNNDDNNNTYTVTTDDFDKDETIGLPAFDPTDKMIVRHKHYTLHYNEKHEQADWVAYHLLAKYTKGNNERKDHFRADPHVPSETAQASDYRGSGYDRGHLAPAADFRYSEEAIDESFYMSNMSPQAPQFNRGIWKGLETKVRDWAIEKKHLYIVSGPILKPRLKTIGTKNKISIPKEFFKIVLNLDPKHPHMIAFLMPNKHCTGLYKDYMVTVDKLEELTGFDFFPNLPDDLETYLENMMTTDSWFDGHEAVPSPVGDMSIEE